MDFKSTIVVFGLIFGLNHSSGQMQCTLQNRPLFVKNLVFNTCVIENSNLRERDTVQIDSRLDRDNRANIEYLIFDEGTLDFIPNEFFNLFPQLKTVRVNNTTLSSIQPEFFKQSHELKSISFRKNQIMRLDNDSFSETKDLETINLSENQINEVYTGTFKGLTKLTQLFLHKNEISGILQNTFKDQRNLEILTLHSNRIENLRNGTFNGLKKLKTLNLHRNFIKKIKNGVFNKLEKLENLTLQNNYIETIEEDSFRGATNLKKIHLDDNKIIKIPALTFNLPNLQEVAFGNGKCINGTFYNVERLSIKLQSQCQPTMCPSTDILSHTTTTECYLNDRPVPCNQNHFPTTEINVRCKLGYTRDEPFKKSINRFYCQEDGTYSGPIMTCGPSCGSSSQLPFDGMKVDIAQVPWHVAVYENDEQICGGTIVTDLVVISAASCFYSEKDTGTIMKKEDIFEFIVGKTSSNYYVNEPLVQKLKAAAIESMPGYHGSKGNFVADFAVVRLNRKIEFKPHIQPVCIDFNDRLSLNSELPVNQIALGAGWGITDGNSKPGEELKALQIPIVNYKTCSDDTDSWSALIAPDKFCAGWTNGSKVFCKRDNGGGLVVPQKIGNSIRYYIRGVVTNNQHTPGQPCENDFYSLFTNVHTYLPLVDQTIKDSLIVAVKNATKPAI